MTTPHTYRRGDRVQVTDKALDKIRERLLEATGEEPRSMHRGTVRQVWKDGLLINFDDGVCAPYALDACTPLLEVVAT